jgi:hypothetical protein
MKADLDVTMCIEEIQDREIAFFKGHFKDMIKVADWLMTV